MRTGKLHLGIDVGTGSARAGLFDDAGRLVGMGVAPILKIRAVASSISPDATRSSTVGPDRNLGLSERRASGQKRPSSYWRVTSAAMSGARMVLNDREKRA